MLLYILLIVIVLLHMADPVTLLHTCIQRVVHVKPFHDG